MNEQIIKNMQKYENDLSLFACKDSSAIRFSTLKDDVRPPFYRDIDKILYSLSYIRYIDKTQVFSNLENDLISKRMIHVQLVSKIARTIGRALNLNEDLIEAASLGHDLGHVPYGHVGENILNEISLENNQGYFNHNVQSVRTLMYIENNGLGNNVTVQVLDAIMCHNGEELKNIYTPTTKTKEEFLKQYNNTYKDKDALKNVASMTLEGCVVRISDVIAYIGKDLEDALTLGIINEEEIPVSIKENLGTTNSEIINKLVNDIIENSINKNYIKISDKIFEDLKALLDFNYKNIYLKANTKEKIKKLKNKFKSLFNLYLNHIENNLHNQDIYIVFLNNMCDKYLNSTTKERIVLDFIAGMTDDYFENQYKKYFEN